MSLFKRRQPLTRKEKLKQALWPSMGWGRTCVYYRHRLFRTDDSPHNITAGLAAGMGVSFSPFLGTHILQTLFFCWLGRWNILAGLIGTALGNPWSYPFIFWLAYKTGVWLCAWGGLAAVVALPEGMAFAHFLDEPGLFTRYLLAHPQKLLLPLTVGGYACGVLCWLGAYGLLYYPVRSVNEAYRRRRWEKCKKAREGKTA